VRCSGEADWPRPSQRREIAGDMMFRKRRSSEEALQMDGTSVGLSLLRKAHVPRSR